MRIAIKFFIICALSINFIFASDYVEHSQAIKDSFVKVMDLYKAGDTKAASKLTGKAYFGHFEFLEGGIRINLGQKKSYDMESQFGQIRKAIKKEKSPEEIQAMIDKLLSEIDEVLPVIEEGHKLVAEKSADGGLADAGINNSDDNDELSNLATTNPWIEIYKRIENEFKAASKAYDAKNKEAVLQALNKVKFELYRNTKLEIAIRTYESQQMDAMIQQILGIALTNNIGMEKYRFDQALKDVGDLIIVSIKKLPKESFKLAPAAEVEEAVVDYTPTVKNINEKLANVLKLYKAGKFEDAIDATQDIYFDEYEESGMENSVGAKNSNLKRDTEASFSHIVSLIKQNASEDKISNGVEKITAAIAKLDSQLQESLELTKKTSNWDLFLYALTIILREGFEALIIIAAVVAYLVKTGNSKNLNIVYSSIAVAVLLSIATAFGINIIFGTQMAGQSREILEGIVMLVAVALLFYVGFWLLSNAGAKKWSKYIGTQIESSLTSGDSKTLWWTVFLAVYREGAETVLFYTALIFDAKTSAALGMVASGFVVGLVILVIVYFIFKIFSLQIPIKPFFIGTSAIIFYMSIAFVGKGIMELVEGKLFIPKIIEGFPTYPWLQTIGIYPYYESLIPQILMILALVFGIIFINKKNSNKSYKEQV